MDVYPGGSIPSHSRAAALHDPLILSHGVVETVEHSACFIQVADENVISVRIVEPPDFRFRQLRLVELAPVAGGFWKRTYRAVREVILVVPAYVRDGVVGPVITADHIACLGDVRRTVLRDIDGAVRIFAECGGGGLAVWCG